MVEHEQILATEIKSEDVIQHVQKEDAVDPVSVTEKTEPSPNRKVKHLKKKRSKRKLVVEVPSVIEEPHVETKTFPRASAGLTQKLEEIKEDCDDADSVIAANLKENRATVKYIQIPSGDSKGVNGVAFSEPSDEHNGDNMGCNLTKSRPPLIRSNTDGSIFLRRLVKQRSSDNMIVRRNSEVLQRNGEAMAPFKGLRRHSEANPSVLKRSGTDISIATTHTDTTLPLSARSLNKRTNRPKSVAGWSKKELELFLPRKTFFSTHDIALSSAGFDVKSDEDRKRPEWRKFMRMRTQDELYPPEPIKEEPTPPCPFGGTGIDFDDAEDDDDELQSLDDVVTSLSGDKDGGSTRRKLRHATKKMLPAEKEEYKPLYDYLKHIQGNPDEYIQMAKFNPKNVDHRHPDRLVRMGRAYRRGHHGTPKNNIYLHAIAGLKQPMPDVPNQKTGRNDKSGAKKDTVEIPDTNVINTTDETEIEKLKIKVERWLKGLNTQQILKAKENALKDIGEEDVTHSKWWITFKTCKYIRVHHPFDTQH